MSRFEIADFELPLARPLSTSRGRVETRQGLIVRDIPLHGPVGYGEASPVPWLGDPSRDEIRRALLAHRAGAPAAGLPVVAQSALACARLDAEARREGVALAVWLGGAPRALRRSQLLSGSVAEWGDAGLGSAGCLKLKVGAGPLEADVARVRAIREAAPHARLRLDANRAWTCDESLRFLAAVEDYDIDFIEEPLREDAAPEGYRRVAAATNIDLALDESLTSSDRLDHHLREGDAAVFVLKLARCGGPRRTFDWGRRVLAAGRRVVLTDSLESGIGAAATLHVAASLPSDAAEAVGLGGAECLAGDIALPPQGRESESTPGGPGLGVTPDPARMRWA